MDTNKYKECLEPNVSNPWNRQKTFFEVAAAQSSVKRPNPNLPDEILCPLVTVLDICGIPSKIHTKVNWSLVESRLKRSSILSQQPRRAPRARPSQKAPADSESSQEQDFSSDGGGSRGSTPTYSGRSAGEPMDLGNVEIAEEIALKREKDQFIDEIVDLVRNIRKYNDPSLSSSPTWIEKLSVEKISKQIVLVQNYLPNLLQIEEIIGSLLFENGPDVVENLIPEMPEYVSTIVNYLTNSPISGTKTRFRNLIIGNIVNLYPYFVRRIIDKYSKTRADCAFACRLAVDHLDDKRFLEFLEPMLIDKNSIINKTVLKSSGRQVLPLVISRLLSMAEAAINPKISESPSEMGGAPWCTRLAYCLVELLISTTEQWREQDIVTITRFVFRTSDKTEVSPGDEKMEYEEVPDSMDSMVPDSDPEASEIAHRKPVGKIIEPSPFGDAHESFVLAALISVPLFTQYPTNETGAVQPPDRAVDQWLDLSRRRVLAGDRIQVSSSFGMHLIYVQMCVMISKIEDLATFAADVMGHPVDLTSRHAHSMVLKNAFTSRCMTDIEVAKRSICQSMSKCVKGDQMPLQTIYGLQQAGVYRTFQIDLKGWLERQLDQCTLPISCILTQVVDLYAKNSALIRGNGLGREFVENTFKGDLFDSRTVAKRLLVLLYLCSYREIAQRQDASLRNMIYDVSIFRKIPTRFLLSVMGNEKENYENIQYIVLRNAAIVYPYMLPTPESMNLVAENQKSAALEVLEEEEYGSDRMERIEKFKELNSISQILEAINQISVRDQIAAIPLVLELFMTSLSPSTPQGFEIPLLSLFHRYEHIDPTLLFEKAAVTWIRDDPEINLDDVIKIPSLLFRCDRRILSSPPHFQCFVRGINHFNKAVRTENGLKDLEMHQRYISAQATHKQALSYSRFLIDTDKKEKEVLNSAYLDTQHSVLIHALIEVSDSKRMKDDPNDFSLLERRKEIRRIACEYIHRTFLDYEALIRIVLLQKVPLRQVRDLVDGIPALFAGIGMIQQMLAIPNKERRLFAVVFAAEICRKYRVRESLETARTVCDIVHSLHKYGELPSSYNMWKHIAPALMILATEFPSLADSINRLLARVVSNAKNRLAVRCGMLAGDPRHEEYRLIELITSFMDRNSLRERL